MPFHREYYKYIYFYYVGVIYDAELPITFYALLTDYNSVQPPNLVLYELLSYLELNRTLILMWKVYNTLSQPYELG